MIHAVGVALANNEVSPYFKEGDPLPNRKRKDLRTAVSLKKGQSGQFVRVPVVEGKKSRADRNRVIGTLKIPAEKIARDVPAGSDIEVTIEIDKSRLIRTKAFIPILDEEFEDVLPLESETPDAKQLIDGLQKTKERLKDLRARAETTSDAKALGLLQSIDGECMVSESERLVGPAATEGDAARQCQNVLNRLNSRLDDVEDALEWPVLVADAEKKLSSARELVTADKYATAEDRRIFEVIERETREAIEHRVPDLLRRRFESLSSLVGDVVVRDPGIWVHWFNEAKEERDKMQDTAQAEKFFAKGDRAINSGDVPGLKEAVRGLWRLLPPEARPQAISDVMV
jgi:molecular chaperone DnaK